jgi:CheY-like chemotaxis protein/anti-sigma regulatory factor (Ser/Thr protein kinase)
VTEAALELSGDTLGSDHRFELALPQAPVWLEADLLRLAQALANVLNNAAKFTPAGGLLRLAAEVQGDEVEVSVSDSGIGLELDEYEPIFDLFGQGRQLGDQPPSGLGVGLALARQLAELHQGSLSVTSAGRDKGATFTFRLPLAAATATEPAGARPLGGAGPRLRILLVDDSIDGARLLCQLLEQLGHEVRVAHHGAAALSLATTFVPDLALLDIGLPDMSGYQLAEQLQRMPTLARTRLVALTGYGQARDRERAFAAGFSEHMVKPVDLDRLMTLLGAGAQLH